MIREVLSTYPFVGFACAAFTLFAVFYAGVLISTFKPGSRASQSRAEQLPLEEA